MSAVTTLLWNADDKLPNSPPGSSTPIVLLSTFWSDRTVVPVLLLPACALLRIDRAAVRIVTGSAAAGRAVLSKAKPTSTNGEYLGMNPPRPQLFCNRQAHPQALQAAARR